MKVERRQIPVGQGCFHVGHIFIDRENDKPDFRYVYDCGSTRITQIDNAVEQYTEGVSHIDALFVSHLDRDHVSGLDALLSRTKIGRVFIPYVDDAMSVLVILDALEGGSLSNDLIEATLEPESWFGRRGVAEVIRVKAPMRKSGEAPDLPFPREDGDRSRSEYSQDRMSLKPPSPFKSRTKRGTPKNAAKLLEMASNDWLAVVCGRRVLDWILIPHVEPVPIVRKRAFKKKIWSALCVESGAAISATVLGEALRSEALRKTLRNCYDEIIPFGGSHAHNRVSMSLYSGPTGQGQTSQWRYEYRVGSLSFDHWSLWGSRSMEGVGWIGTGDATLKIKDVRSAWFEAYKPVLAQVSTLLLPHHGSKHNFHEDLLTRLPNLAMCVAAAKDASKHHPSRSVMGTVVDCKKQFHHVSENLRSELQEIVMEGRPPC